MDGGLRRPVRGNQQVGEPEVPLEITKEQFSSRNTDFRPTSESTIHPHPERLAAVQRVTGGRPDLAPIASAMIAVTKLLILTPSRSACLVNLR